MISIEGLKVEFNATVLFEDVSYVINKKDRIALVGKNGAGKSTMLKILAGLQTPSAGIVAMPKEVTIGYLPQVMSETKKIKTALVSVYHKEGLDEIITKLHAILLSIEYFSFVHWGALLLKIVASSSLTVICILALEGMNKK